MNINLLIVCISVILQIVITMKTNKTSKYLHQFFYPNYNSYSYNKQNQLKIESCNCGKYYSPVNFKQNSAFFRIVNGTEILIKNQYPWLALIQYNQTFICAGTLISNLYIITAAHCIQNVEKKDNLKVVLGVHNRCVESSTTVVLSIAEIIIHADFDKFTYAHDVALLKMTTRIHFNRQIQPICLPALDLYANTVSNKYQNKRGIIVGWGVTVPGDVNSTSCVPREATVPILNRSNCLNEDITLFCAGYFDGLIDTCQGDSGGPLQVLNKQRKYELIGIISSGEGCALPGNPGLYTDVLQHLNWIYQKSLDGLPCLHSYLNNYL